MEMAGQAEALRALVASVRVDTAVVMRGAAGQHQAAPAPELSARVRGHAVEEGSETRAEEAGRSQWSRQGESTVWEEQDK
jgi:hypothetical protein